ncbi:hypothetical protein MAPG_09611 [Magnaporthiopsis poae ATCC 64411]|uniref:Zn(2)-C6 fungal-type domain-containing protein n=1 Tax=Magnaporthiopsis poae (strain ATCC 64411 / 73-15) TaxID=644358 RepID=A0A0C4EAE2_MAGP6|nr:hypothetical protein MAPG_09611 [Magnaporthiopsis poae ATCC 64411]
MPGRKGLESPATVTAMASAAPTASTATKSPRILACVLCQHRKIKCDRSFPCANCLKANVQCTPSTPAPPRKRRRPNQDLQERLARCEELLREYASEGKSEDSPSTPTHSSTSPQHTPKPSEEPMLNWHKHGKLIKQEGGTTRFIDSYVVSTIYDELRAMRTIIDDDEPSPEEDPLDGLTPDMNSADLLMGGDTPQSPPSTVDIHPDAGQMLRLWQVFLDRVNPLFKVIHAPTVQPYLVDATNRSADRPFPRNVEALLFAIYTLAAVALSDEECHTLLGYSRDTAIQRFSSGVRLCLNQAKFLKNHDLTTLQAFVLYLISIQGRYNQHATWILHGVAVRIAQKMGLHRDGTSFGLSPFDIEMRRRLWWQIIMLDARFAFMSGLGHALLPRVWDTKEPRNLNDADLYASAAELPPDRDSPTEMVFCVIQNRLTRFIVETPGLDPSFLFDENSTRGIHEGPSKEKLEEYRAMLAVTTRDVAEIMEKRCDPSAGPIHEFTYEFISIIMGKVQMLLSPEHKKDWGSSPKDHVFRLAVEGLEHHVRHHRTALKTGFLWYTRLQLHEELFIFLAGQLCHRPDGPLSDKAWEYLEAFEPLHPDLFNPNSSRTHMSLAIYLVKAWNAREEHFMQQVGLPLPTPTFIERLREAVPQIKVESPSSINNREDLGGSGVKVKLAENDPIFDDFMGNYVEGGDWDIFSNIALGPTATAGFGAPNSNLMGMNMSGVQGTNHMPPGLVGLFGLGTEWKDGGGGF